MRRVTHAIHRGDPPHHQVLSSALKSVTINPITKNFLLLLAENGRINILDKIQTAYKTIMQAHRN